MLIKEVELMNSRPCGVYVNSLPIEPYYFIGIDKLWLVVNADM